MKKLTSLLLTMTLVMASTLSVFAATPKVTVENADTGYTASTDITAEITAEMLGSDVVVTVPSLISFDSSTSKNGSNYSQLGTITAKGAIESDKFLYIGMNAGYPLTLTNTTNSALKAKVVPQWTGDQAATAEYLNNSISAGYAEGVALFGQKIAPTDLANSVQLATEYALQADSLVAIGTYTGVVPYYIAVCADNATYESISF